MSKTLDSRHKWKWRRREITFRNWVFQAFFFVCSQISARNTEKTENEKLMIYEKLMLKRLIILQQIKTCWVRIKPI